MDRKKLALTAEKKKELLEYFRKMLDSDTLLMPDMIEILDIMKRAAERRQQEMLAEYPWLEPSDKVQ